MIGVLYFLVTTLLALVIWGAKKIFTGELVPRQSVARTTVNWKEQLEESRTVGAEWKSYYEAERAIGVNSRENRDILLAVSKTMDKVLRSLPTADDTNAGG